MKPPKHWKPLQRATHIAPPSEEYMQAVMSSLGVDRDTALEYVDREETKVEYWLNDIYQVQVKRDTKSAHINIRRRDGRPIFRDWRHFQWIKNQLVGEECEGIELYPAESRLVDTSNKYHIFCITDPTFRFPFGFDRKDVDYTSKSKQPGLRQRPWDAT